MKNVKDLRGIFPGTFPKFAISETLLDPYSLYMSFTDVFNQIDVHPIKSHVHKVPSCMHGHGCTVSM